MDEKRYYVYILTNPRNTVLYTGMTNNLPRRLEEHKRKTIFGFTTKYNVNKLVYAEIHETSYAAIVREKQIKAGSRRKKITLIESLNPLWSDLSQTIDLC